MHILHKTLQTIKLLFNICYICAFWCGMANIPR